MAVNLVSLIMQFLTPDMIGRIASALGLDRNNTQTAIGAAIPGLLAGLSGVAAQPGGAQKLVDTVRQQTGALGSFANMIGASGQSSLIEKGSQILSSLLDGRDQTALAGAVGKYAGLGQNASGSLLGMLAPIVMGTIGQEQGTRSLDAGAITSLLSSQKDNIAAALPAGFANLLGGTGLLDSLGGADSDRCRGPNRQGDHFRRSSHRRYRSARRGCLAQLALLAHPASGDRRPAHLFLCQARGASGPAEHTYRPESNGRRARYWQAGHRQRHQPAHCARRYHRRRLCASGITKTARGHGPDRQGRRPVRAVVTGAAEGPRRDSQSADAVAQPAVRQGAGDPRRRRAVEADDRRPAGETRVADHLTLQAAIINRRRRAGG